jgi:hypothetical protein
MKSMETLQEKTSPIIKGAWVTLGIPLALPGIDEKVEGIIDIEALIMTTLLMMEQDRMVTDLPAWLSRFSTLINHQKLKSMLKSMPRQQSSVIVENVSRVPLRAAPKSIRNIFNVEPASEAVSETIQMRVHKLNTVENVAQSSIMIHSRLQYGTSFRADIIALTNIKGFAMKGTRLAKVLCTNDSTVSRILTDLRACRFLDQDNQRVGHIEPYPRMFISSQSLWNLCEMMDAFRFSFEELKRGAFESLDLRHDGLGKKLLKELN